MQVNPLFQTINVKGEAMSRGALQVVADSPLNKHEHRAKNFNREEAQLTKETIASMIEPPAMEAWESIRGVFVGLVQQVDALSSEVANLKRSQGLRGVAASGSDDATAHARELLDSVRGSSGARHVVVPKSRRTFGQVQSSGEADSKGEATIDVAADVATTTNPLMRLSAPPPGVVPPPVKPLPPPPARK